MSFAAVSIYLLTSNQEGNTKQLPNITNAATGLELGLSQTYPPSIHEQANDTIHAQSLRHISFYVMRFEDGGKVTSNAVENMKNFSPECEELAHPSISLYGND